MVFRGWSKFNFQFLTFTYECSSEINYAGNWLLMGQNLGIVFDFYFLFLVLKWKRFWFSSGCSKSGFYFSTLVYECSSIINYAVTECSWELVTDGPKFGDGFQFLFLISSVVVKEMWIFRWWVTCTNLNFFISIIEVEQKVCVVQ